MRKSRGKKEKKKIKQRKKERKKKKKKKRKKRRRKVEEKEKKRWGRRKMAVNDDLNLAVFSEEESDISLTFLCSQVLLPLLKSKPHISAYSPSYFVGLNIYRIFFFSFLPFFLSFFLSFFLTFFLSFNLSLSFSLSLFFIFLSFFCVVDIQMKRRRERNKESQSSFRTNESSRFKFTS